VDLRGGGAVEYDSVKLHEGRPYTGMRVGGRHAWKYDGVWRETKTSPDEWTLEFTGKEFSYEARKTRARAAPPGSGCEVGTTYHWLVLGSQFATKVDANAYDTFLMGLKWRIGVQGPGEAWSYERHGNVGAKARVVRTLDDLLTRVRTDAPAGGVVGEGFEKIQPVRHQQARLVG
jgi:hypothetical protein